MELNFDLVPRQNSCDRHLKEVRAMLFEQSGRLALALSLLKSLLGFFFFLNLGCDSALSKSHRHAMNGSSGGGWKEVGGVERLAAFVRESLCECDLSKRPSDGHFGMSLFQWKDLMSGIIMAVIDLKVGEQ